MAVFHPYSARSLFFNIVIHCNPSLNKLGKLRGQMSKPGFDCNSPTLVFGCAIVLFMGSPLLIFKKVNLLSLHHYLSAFNSIIYKIAIF